MSDLYVLKFGGNAIRGRADMMRLSAEISQLIHGGDRILLVHGGGPEIGGMLQKIGKQSRFVDGLRYTDEETMDVVRKVRYDSAFTFQYSRRTGTPAAAMEDQIPVDVVKDRFDRLLAEVQEISREVTARHTHTVQEVLVESINEQDPSLVTGRMSNNTLVHFKGDASLIGTLQNVYLDECRGFYYMGTTVENN